MGRELTMHGDFVKDVAFDVDNLRAFIKEIKQRGLRVVEDVTELSDESGSVLSATICGSAGSIVHTLIEKIDYGGIFLPGFQPISDFRLNRALQRVDFFEIDHVVEGHPEGNVAEVVAWYERTLRMARFWSIDESIYGTESSAMRASFVTNAAKATKVVLVEPVAGRGKAQIQEYLDYHGGPGIQHVAFRVTDIVEAVGRLRERGVDFLEIPDTYYKLLRLRLSHSDVEVKEDLDLIQKFGILVDFDEKGYLLQIFTKPMQDRPTLFIEIIQRYNFEGFGAGNLKALFAAVEMDQKRREESEKESRVAQ